MVSRWDCRCKNCDDLIAEMDNFEGELPSECPNCGGQGFKIEENENWREEARKEEHEEEPDMDITTIEQMEHDKHWEGKR